MSKINLFGKKEKSEEKDINYSRVSVVPQENQRISVSFQKTIDFLAELNRESDTIKCIDLILDKTSDGKQALNIYLRLANQGISIEWFNANNGKPIKKYNKESDDFCSRLGKNNNSGLDGLLDQFHYSAIAHGGMACEILVDKKMSDISDVALIDPATFSRFEWIPNENRYAIYQKSTGGKEVDLYTGNFLYVPHQPKVGRPEGSLQFEPAVLAVTQFYTLFDTSLQILKRIGYPRYKFTINRKDFIDSLPASCKTPEKIKKMLEDHIANIRVQSSKFRADSDLILTDDTGVEVIGGGVNGAGVDVRAWFEVIEPLLINGFQLTPVLMGRLKGGSYSLGSVEFKIVTDTVDSMRRASKRILEDILKMWARVKGYNIYPKVTHNPIDWEKELDKLNAQLKNMEKNRRAQEYGWISSDEAASSALGVEKADNEDSKGLYEYLKKSTGASSASVTDNEDEIVIEEPIEPTEGEQ